LIVDTIMQRWPSAAAGYSGRTAHEVEIVNQRQVVGQLVGIALRSHVPAPIVTKIQ
jgi:hypothetical protein